MVRHLGDSAMSNAGGMKPHDEGDRDAKNRQEEGRGNGAESQECKVLRDRCCKGQQHAWPCTMNLAVRHELQLLQPFLLCQRRPVGLRITAGIHGTVVKRA